jgi:hypothetical protein
MINQPTEHEIQQSIMDWCALRGFVAVRINSGGVRATNAMGKERFIRFNRTPGCSDILACVGGTFVAIEVKRPGARTDAKRLQMQQAFLDRVAKAGGIGVIATSVADVERVINEAIEQGAK